MSSGYRQIPKEVTERQAQELSDMLSELIEKAESLKRRLSGEFEQGFEFPWGYSNSTESVIQ